MEFIDLNIFKGSNDATIKRVRKFTIDLEDEVAEYEELLNKEDAEIFEEQFSYDRAGRAVITVWWTEPSENNL